MALQEDLPRALDVQRFAEARQAEILSLEATVQDSHAKWGIKALPRHLRRRATSHNSYIHKRRPNHKLQEARAKATAETTDGAGAPCNRAMRRRKARLQQGFVQRLTAGPGTLKSGKPRKLETHVWHAKRMEMVTRWGHKLALGAPGKGHGSRAFLHTLRHGTVIHDSSYWLASELCGPSHSLLSMLKSMCDPEAVNAFVARIGTQYGAYEQDLVLHHVHSFPLRAIAPMKVTFYQGLKGLEAQPMEEINHAEPGRLVLFVHAAAHDEAMHAISLAVANFDVEIHPRYDLRRLEIKGALSDRAIAAALPLADSLLHSSLPAAPRYQISEELIKLLQATGGATGAQQPSNSVLRVRVQDPRLTKPIRLLGDIGEGPRTAADRLPRLPAYREEIKEARSLAEQLSLHDSSSLVWKASSVPHPLSEAAVSSHRQQRKLAGLLQDASPEPLPELLREDTSRLVWQAMCCCQQLPPALEAGRLFSALHTPEPLPQERTSCPILMARQAPKDRKAVPSWTLVVPAGWVSPIWQALIFQGARSAGQREWRWAAMQQDEAFFPHDHADTLAYTQLQAELAAEQDEQCSLRPKGRYSNRMPHPPRWDLVGCAVPVLTDSTLSRVPESAQGQSAAVKKDVSMRPSAISLKHHPETPTLEAVGVEMIFPSHYEPGEAAAASAEEADVQAHEDAPKAPAADAPGDASNAMAGNSATAASRDAQDLAAMEADTLTPGSYAVLENSAAAALSGAGQPAAMDVDTSVPEQETSNAQGHVEQKQARGSSAQVQLFIARSQHVSQRCLEHGSQHKQSPRHPTQMDHGTTEPPAEASDATAAAQAESSEPEKAAQHLQSIETGATGGTGAVQPCRNAGPSCMVRMSLHTVGPGVLHEGAAILCLGGEEASGIGHSMLHHKLKGKAGDDHQRVQSLKEALAELQHKLNRQHRPPSEGDVEHFPQAASAEPQSAAAQQIPATQQTAVDGSWLLLGFVISEAPRGLLGRGAHALCLAPLLNAHRALQTPDKEAGGVLVAYKSPLSSVLRVAEARTCVSNAA